MGSKQTASNAKAAKECRVGKPVLVRLDTVQPKSIVWLWPGRIPIGKLTMLSGDPGLGKSLLTIDMGAGVDRRTRGPILPNLPRWAACSCCPLKMTRPTRSALDWTRPGPTVRVSVSWPAFHVSTWRKCERFLATFNLARDLRALEQAVESTPDCRLVVIDPISAFCGATDSHRNSDVRGLLAPLAELAQRRQVAVVGVNHLNKSAAGGPAMYRTMGSLAFVAAARAAWAVVKDKQDPGKRLFLPIKNNLAADIAGLSYTVLDKSGHPCLRGRPIP